MDQRFIDFLRRDSIALYHVAGLLRQWNSADDDLLLRDTIEHLHDGQFAEEHVTRTIDAFAVLVQQLAERK